MLPSFFLSLREGLEAALIIGIVLGALRKIHQEWLVPTVWLGAAGAAAISIIVALLLTAAGTSFEGAAEEIFEGFTMLTAAGVLTWMIFWMHRQARGIKTELEAGVRRSVVKNGGKALFLLAFTAVLREGIELALFLTAAALATDGQQVLFGAVIGLAASAALGWGLFSSIIKLDLQRFFLVTSILLILFAAGLVGHAVHEFNEVGWIPGIVEPVWDLSSVLPEDSFLGQIMAALFGYNANPSLTEVGAYLIYFGTILVLNLSLNRRTVTAAAQ